MNKLILLGAVICALQVNAQYSDTSGVGTTTTTTTTGSGSDTSIDATSTTVDTDVDRTTTVTTDTTTTNVNTPSTTPVYREQDSYGISSTTPRRYMGGAPEGWASFIEISSGYTADNDEVPVEGVPSSVKLLGSYYTPSTAGVFDLGIGTHTQTFIDDFARDESTTTAVMELAARYQFETRWQLGVVYNQFFDRGENYFSNQADAMFGGLQLLKEFSLGTDTHMRLGLRAMRDINTENQDIDMAQLDLAIGYDGH